MSGHFYCRKCARRLNVDAVEGRAVVICRHCKEKTVIESKPAFRAVVELKRA